MARSLSSFLLPISLLASAAYGAVVTYDFEAGWVYANPDGQQTRPVQGINGQWPIPPIVANVGDQIIVNLKNSLGNESTSLHFHGLYMNGTTHMDGPVAVTQCAVVPGSSFTYNFTINQPGTYWYHSHERGQYPDGIRGPLIIHDPEDPFKDMYDEEIVITLSDWYHELMQPLLSQFISVANPSGAEPVPQAALMNDTQNLSVKIEPGKTYLFRLVNMGAFAAQYVWFEEHTMKIVEVDGIYTEPTDANMLYLTAAQRYSVLVTAKNDTNSNFAFVGSMDQDLFDAIPDGLNPNVTGWLVYDDSKEKPAPKEAQAFEPFDDFTLVPYDKGALLEHVDRTITLDMKMDNLDDGANYAFFNDVTYVHPKVPTLYSVLSTGENATNPAIYGSNTNSFVLAAQNEVVEIVLNNNDPGKHPFHLHGHAFQLVTRSEEEAGAYDPANTTTPSATPMRRDTVLVRPNGHIALRFRSDNPGVWLFHWYVFISSLSNSLPGSLLSATSLLTKPPSHSHIEWHVASGLTATIIERPLDIQSQLAGHIPTDHLAACAAGQVPTAGNAAGNTLDLLDLTGENKSPGTLPAGFTARGIVALVFSCVAAFVGMAVIAGYGLRPLKVRVA
ncbi:similar to iron transport multicopper oxidase FET3 [Plenodomus lingam JN3]|uniref:Similar to iron transport multicopper oxidase FET3 n=1 Tax=Leptosphaeria maculans (strain JN3 / isolate v23.1.3 / race Av1-4-5-6-7-8) TaxID=985895 RepID=E5A7A1_LEPMJ|nr:similar to iron transport multicopper oxidase FET3 [Plenodomus lingam JN3]CBX99496.1 similar to iron transport multicopper oxidase FET3 [Plenodomus lingam JN3]